MAIYSNCFNPGDARYDAKSNTPDQDPASAPVFEDVPVANATSTFDPTPPSPATSFVNVVAIIVIIFFYFQWKRVDFRAKVRYSKRSPTVRDSHERISI